MNIQDFNLHRQSLKNMVEVGIAISNCTNELLIKIPKNTLERAIEEIRQEWEEKKSQIELYQIRQREQNLFKNILNSVSREGVSNIGEKYYQIAQKFKQFYLSELTTAKPIFFKQCQICNQFVSNDCYRLSSHIKTHQKAQINDRQKQQQKQEHYMNDKIDKDQFLEMSYSESKQQEQKKIKRHKLKKTKSSQLVKLNKTKIIQKSEKRITFKRQFQQSNQIKNRGSKSKIQDKDLFLSLFQNYSEKEQIYFSEPESS